MAYCRCDESGCKVYMFAGLNGYNFHFSNELNPQPKSFYVETAEEALEKLIEYQNAGLGVPDYAIEKLASEIEADLIEQQAIINQLVEKYADKIAEIA